MSKIISVINQKGGTGKTTTALALISGLTARGYNVLAIDLDPQCNLSYSLGAKRTDGTSDGLFTGKDIKQCIQEVCKNCSLIASTPTLTSADREYTDTGREYLLREALTPIKGDYDFIVIDNPPHLGILTVNALTTSDEVIIPTIAEVFSLQGIGDLAKTINTVKKYTNPNLTVRGMLLTMYNPRRSMTQALTKTLEQYAEALNTKLFKTHIRIGVAISEAQLNKADLLTYDVKSKAIQDYNDFINEYLEDN